MLWSNFNSSLWHALWLLLPIGGLVFLVEFLSLKKGHFYFFDPKHNVEPKLQQEGGNYEPHSKRYQDLAKLAITLSAAAIAFLVSVAGSDKTLDPTFARRIREVAPVVSGFFGSSITFLVLFMLLQALWYEEYCHSPDHSTYKRWKYAASTSLGMMGLVAFVLGFLWLAHNLFG